MKSRWLLVLVAALTAASAAIAWPNWGRRTGWSLVDNWSRPAVVQGCGTLPTSVPWVWIFDADNIDGLGTGNAAFANGDYVTTWTDVGGSDPDSASIGVTSNDAYKPTFANNAVNSRDAVAFDGIADHRQIATSTDSAAFLHSSGDFHVIVVFRPDSFVDFKTLLANTNTSATDGFILWMTSTGAVRTLIAREVGGTFAFDLTSSFTYSVGTWAVFEVKAESTPPASGTLSIAKNFGTFSTQALLNTFGSGNAPYNLTIGASPPAEPPDFPFDGAMSMVLISSRELTADERSSVQTVVTCRYGI